MNTLNLRMIDQKTLKKLDICLETLKFWLPRMHIQYTSLWVKKWMLAMIFASCIQLMPLWSQLNVESAVNGFYTPEELIQNVFQGDGVTILSVNYTGKNEAVGLFTQAADFLPIDEGLILTTGSAFLAESPNNSESVGTLWADQTPDADLSAIASDPIEDLTRYEVTFIPSSDRISFRYLLASEEYPEFACTDFNDVFGFFLTGPNPNGPDYQANNIAFVPDPADPSGLTFTNIPVSINSINGNGFDPGMGCNYDFAQYYNPVSSGNYPTYDAYLDAFYATAEVIPCETYTIKIAVADVSDDEYDTAIFLEGKSFSAVAPTLSFANNPLINVITEGCDQLALSISIPFPLATDTIINLSLVGTASGGEDFVDINSEVVIPAGQTSVLIPIETIDDGIIEVQETIGFLLNACDSDTLWLTIQDQDNFDPGYPEILSQCSGPLEIIAENDLSITDQSFRNEDNIAIPFVGQQEIGAAPLSSPILVSGLDQYNLTDGIIKSICLNIDHPFASHIDIYLKSPYGKIVELSTNNGAGGSNYTGTCFTANATQSIANNPAPHTGSFLPETSFSTISEYSKNVNGYWQLIVKDNTDDGINGTLIGWEITFNTAYAPNYFWSPAAGLSCTNCENPVANPVGSTTYTVSYDDPFGCPVSDEIIIERELPTIPVITEPISCPGDANGYITAQIGDEGVPPFTFDWGSLGSDSIVGPLSMGTYEVTISDSNGCTAAQEVDLTDPDSLQITIDAILPCAIDDASGQITAVITGGTPGFDYQWSTNANGTNSNNINELISDSYQLTVTDNAGCTAVESYFLEAGTLTASAAVTAISCFGEKNGVVELEVLGGTAPYQFLLNEIDQGNSSKFTGLAAGVYTVDILDANDCEWQLEGIVVESPLPLFLDLGEDIVMALGDEPNLNITIENAQGALQEYTWNWGIDDLPFLSCSTCSNPQIQGLIFSDAFNLTLIDGNNCRASDQLFYQY